MVFLGVATAAGIFELSISTALRKLAEAGQGLEKISEHVHRFDRFEERVRADSFIWSESIANYFWPLPNGEWRLLRDLPCKVPTDWQGGYIVYGYTDTGLQAAFVRALPIELESAPEPQGTAHVQNFDTDLPPVAEASNHVTCECGATIAAKTRRQALRALAEHKRILHKN
jgi:hypothetical protein